MDEALIELAFTVIIYIGKFFYYVISGVLSRIASIFPKISKLLNKRFGNAKG